MQKSMQRLLTTATLNMTSEEPAADKVMEDTALMTAIASGDRDAFNLFLSRHLSAVVQFIRRYLPSQADAEDIAQETFFRVWQKAASWQPQGYSPRSWLYRIAYHLCIDEIRRRPQHEPASEMTIDQPSNNPETAIEKDSDLNRLAHLLSLLPERQRTALSLCALQGLSNQEAATVMEISVEALESLLARGRRQLRSHLQ
jgi:RNA polymerase sigma-70 factor (ECF subfamily)